MKKKGISVKKSEQLPLFFKPILWSYNFPEIDLEKDKKTIIINTINYGDFSHWRWIAAYYGVKMIRTVLEQTPTSALRPQARRLAAILFSITNFRYASRSIK